MTKFVWASFVFYLQQKQGQLALCKQEIEIKSQQDVLEVRTQKSIICDREKYIVVWQYRIQFVSGSKEYE